MVLEKFKLTYVIDSNTFNYNGKVESFITIQLKNQNKLSFVCKENKLTFDINFFLVENIFYWFDNLNNKYIISNYSEEDWAFSATSIDEFKRIGYYPLSKCKYEGKRVLLSFLNYEFASVIKVGSSLNCILGVKGSYQDVSKSFLSEIDNFKKKNTQKNLVLPLSGGIDSRLLFHFFWSSTNLFCYTHGESDSGDMIIAEQIISKYSVNNYVKFDISNLNLKQIQRNIKACDYFLPLERVIYPIPDDLFDLEDFTILSGLYGDVIFSDKNKKKSFKDYINCSIPDVNFDNIDHQIIKCYSEINISEKLVLLLLRCQKMTKQSLNMSLEKNDCFIPFLKNSVLSQVENCNTKYLYKKIIKSNLNKDLSNILHQTTLSTFTYPELIRFCQKVFFKVLYKKYSKPYFTETILNRFK